MADDALGCLAAEAMRSEVESVIFVLLLFSPILLLVGLWNELRDWVQK